MFERFTVSTALGREFSLPRRSYYALAIAGDSDIDLVLADGVEVGPGSPALYSGAPRTIALKRVRSISGSLELLAVIDPRGLAAVPRRRSLKRVETRLNIAAAGSLATAVVVAGRRHTSIGIDSGNTAGRTVTVLGRRYCGGIPLVSATLYNARAIPATGLDAFEVGGTDHEECWDDLLITVANPTGTEIVSGSLVTESYGELGD